MVQTKAGDGGTGEFATGTLVTKTNIVAIRVDTGASLRFEDDASKEAVERVLQFIQPMMYEIPTGGLVNAQDETSYDNMGTKGTFVGGATQAAADVVTLNDGTTVTVDAVASGVVTEFTLNTSASNSAVLSSNAVLTQTSTTGSGTGFTLTPKDSNLTSTGLIYAVVDGHNFEASALQAQIRAVGVARDAANVALEGYDFSGTTVQLGTSLVVSA